MDWLLNKIVRFVLVVLTWLATAGSALVMIKHLNDTYALTMMGSVFLLSITVSCLVVAVVASAPSDELCDECWEKKETKFLAAFTAVQIVTILALAVVI